MIDFDIMLQLTGYTLLVVLLLACTMFLDEILMKIYYKFAVNRCNEICNWTEQELIDEHE